MKNNYPDIRDLTPAKPMWYDSNGVPRYRQFTPDMLPSIYAVACCLLSIECQVCKEPFRVALEQEFFDTDKFVRMIADHSMCYGDPPNHGCVGDTMNSELICVEEVWTKPDFHTWSKYTIPEVIRSNAESCNAHDALLAACKEFVAYSECHCTNADGSCAYCMGLKAIALGEGTY